MTRAGEPSSFFALTLAGPAVVLLVVAAVVSTAALAGYRPFAAPVDLTLSEAAAIRDEAEVLRQLSHGANPDVPGIVRRGLLTDGEYLLTPLEAAVAARHTEVVRLLLRHGVELNVTNFPVLFCLAQERAAADIIALLKDHAPAGAVFECESIRLPL